MVNIIYEHGIFFDLNLVAIALDEDELVYSFTSDYSYVGVGTGVKIKKFVDKDRLFRTLVKNVKFQDGETYNGNYIQEKTYEVLRNLDYCEEKKSSKVKFMVANETTNEEV